MVQITGFKQRINGEGPFRLDAGFILTRYGAD
nr:MAG TPA: hypothetical protein [Bacteriophage sp.]